MFIFHLNIEPDIISCTIIYYLFNPLNITHPLFTSSCKFHEYNTIWCFALISLMNILLFAGYDFTWGITTDKFSDFLRRLRRYEVLTILRRRHIEANILSLLYHNTFYVTKISHRGGMMSSSPPPHVRTPLVNWNN